MGIEYISIKGAAQRLGITEKEIEELIANKAIEYKTEYGITMVTKDSVYNYSGLNSDGNQTKNKKRVGRQPKVLSHGEAAELLNSHIPGGVPADADSVAQMAFDDVLEEWGLPHSEEIGVTNRSVQEFLKSVTVAQEEESVECEKATEEITHIEETKPDTEGLASLLTHEEAVQEFIELIQDPVEKVSPEMVPVSDMRAAVKIARMQGELDTYRSMQSFERRA